MTGGKMRVWLPWTRNSHHPSEYKQNVLRISAWIWMQQPLFQSSTIIQFLSHPVRRNEHLYTPLHTGPSNVALWWPVPLSAQIMHLADNKNKLHNIRVHSAELFIMMNREIGWLSTNQRQYRCTVVHVARHSFRGANHLKYLRYEIFRFSKGFLPKTYEIFDLSYEFPEIPYKWFTPQFVYFKLDSNA